MMYLTTKLRSRHYLLALCMTASSFFAPAAASNELTEDDSLPITKKYTEALFNWVSTLGVSFGGAERSKLNYDNSEQQIEAGSAYYMGIGGQYRLLDSPFSFQGMIASQFDSADADDGDASPIDRATFDLISFYHLKAHRLGIGITHQMSPKFQTENDFDNHATHFQDSTGYILEYNYALDYQTEIGVRYTDINYRSQSAFNKDVNGDNVGLFIKSFF